MAIRSGDPAIYLVSKVGLIQVLRGGVVDPSSALDLSSVVSRGSEQGLLGLAFSRDGRFAYVNYTDRHGDTNIVEYSWRDGRADLSSRRLVLFVRQPHPNHNGGDLVFGPDGDLYIGLGDGGSGPNTGVDPHHNGQNRGVLLGKMLRLDPRPSPGRAYGIPANNPFVGQANVRPEIWAYGLRNPWRYSFDRETSDLWIADVGAGAEEEIDVQPARSAGGQNYGWSRLEGTHVLQSPPPPPPDAIPPVYEYNHQSGGCAITGGFVYRGSAIPGLRGWYVFGDFCLGGLNALQLAGGRSIEETLHANVPELSSFGEDQDGELYALSLAGGVYRLEP
jgi:glucose/arabinose dehydrogenase